MSTGFKSSDSRRCIEVHVEETENLEDCLGRLTDVANYTLFRRFHQRQNNEQSERSHASLRPTESRSRFCPHLNYWGRVPGLPPDSTHMVTLTLMHFSFNIVQSYCKHLCDHAILNVRIKMSAMIIMNIKNNDDYYTDILKRTFSKASKVKCSCSC